MSDLSCDVSEQTVLSPTLVLPTTAAWGDVVGMNSASLPNGITNISDVAALVDCFRDVSGAPPKTWCDLVPDASGDMNLNVNISDIAAGVDAFKEIPYWLPGPSAPNPCP